MNSSTQQLMEVSVSPYGVHVSTGDKNAKHIILTLIVVIAIVTTAVASYNSIQRRKAILKAKETN